MSGAAVIAAARAFVEADRAYSEAMDMDPRGPKINELAGRMVDAGRRLDEAVDALGSAPVTPPEDPARLRRALDIAMSALRRAGDGAATDQPFSASAFAFAREQVVRAERGE